MPLFRMNIRDGKIQNMAQPDKLPTVLIDEINALPDGAPIIILLHGYNFSPFRQLKNPHRHILSYRPDPRCWKAISWPRHMGFGRGRKGEGLCLAIGWNAMGSLRQAYERAKPTGHEVARVVDMIHEMAPERRINIMGHSLGARVALSVLPALKSGHVSRMILLAGAEFCTTAIRAMECPAGRAVEVVNITSRDNDLFDFLFEFSMGKARRRGFSIAVGLHNQLPNWVDFQMDHEGTEQQIRAAGYNLAPASRRVCHWSTYLRGGVFPFYSAILRQHETLSLEQLNNMVPDRLDRRWSRLVTVVTLPKARKRLALSNLRSMMR